MNIEKLLLAILMSLIVLLGITMIGMLIVVGFYDEYECDDKPCECCGDFVETFKMNIIL